MDLKSLSPTFLVRVYDRLRDSFWFLPTVAIVLAVLAAATIVHFDRGIKLSEVPLLGWTQTTPDAARTMLSVLSGGLITVLGVTLSMMMLVLSQTANALGPRVVRTVVSGNELQITLASFVAATAFCLTTLRSVREPEAGPAPERSGVSSEATQAVRDAVPASIQESDDRDQRTGSDEEGRGFVPEIAVVASTVGFFMAIGTLVYFVDHVCRIIRVPSLLARLAEDLADSIDQNFPEGPNPPGPQPIAPPKAAVETTVTAGAEGYIQGIDAERLADRAAKVDGLARVLVRVGQFVDRGTELLRMEADRGLGEDGLDEIRDGFAVGDHRTPRQDVEGIVLEVAEVGIRALSPGLNDPRTAVMCVHRLTAGLSVIAARPAPKTEVRDDEGRLRLVRPSIEFLTLLEAAFRDIAFYCAGDLGVMHALTDGLRQIAESCGDDSRRRAASQIATRLRAEFGHQTAVEDRADVTAYRSLLDQMADI